MTSRAEFARGLVRIAVACRQPLDDATIEVYSEAISEQTDAVEWEGFTRDAVRSGRWRFLPTVREVLDALRKFRGEPALEVEAVQAYDRVLQAGVYSANGGTSWTFRRVQETCGRAAAEAFQAAGGSHAFATTWDEAKRRDLFVREYATAVRDDPATRLLPAVPRFALPAGDEERDSSPAEAGALLRLVHDKVGRDR